MVLRFVKNFIKKQVKSLEDWEISRNISNKSFFEDKAFYFDTVIVQLPPHQRVKAKKLYYIHQDFYTKYHFRKFVNHFKNLDISNTYLDFVRWVFVDIITGKRRGTCGIYCFVGMRGQGKTMSMVAHIERFRKRYAEAGKKYVVATNFDYKYQDCSIDDWTDIIIVAKDCYDKDIPCLIAFDEIQNTFDSLEYKDFPPAMGAFVSFVRKYNAEFLVSAQQYDRIPKRIRDNADFIIVCENVLHCDRLFRGYYFEKKSYDFEFADTKGKKKKSTFLREFVADDAFYELYDTRKQVERMVTDTKAEKAKQKAAMDYLNNIS